MPDEKKDVIALRLPQLEKAITDRLFIHFLYEVSSGIQLSVHVTSATRSGVLL